MRKKLLFRLCLILTVFLSLYSCIHDEFISSSDPSSIEYINKSLWKQDEKYISNVMKVYAENEAEIKKINGIPYWNFATTVDSFDESFVAIPIVDNGKVISVLKVPRHGAKIYFYYTHDESDLLFFQGLIFAKNKKAGMMDGSTAQTNGMACTRQWISVWLPDSESNPDGAGHWSSTSIIKCESTKDECIGIALPNGDCDLTGGTDGGYPYPGGGGEGTEPVDEEEDPCEETKKMLANPAIEAKINELKSQSTAGGEKGFKIKKDGTTSVMIDGGGHEVDLGDRTGWQGGYHNHTPTGIPMHSPPDIDNGLLKFARAQPTGEHNNAYFGMIVKKICSTCTVGFKIYHYVIRFKGTYNDAITNFSQEDLDNYNIRYQTRYGMNKPENNDMSHEQLERFFFKTLKDMGLEEKVDLQRVDDGAIKTVNLNSDGTITSIPCP